MVAYGFFNYAVACGYFTGELTAPFSLYDFAVELEKSFWKLFLAILAEFMNSPPIEWVLYLPTVPYTILEKSGPTGSTFNCLS